MMNASIEEIGMYMYPHYGTWIICMTLNLETGGSCRVTIPDKKINEFVHLFVCDKDYSEDGFYLHELEGKYLRIVMNKDNIVTEIGHIIQDRWIDLDIEIEEKED